MVGRESEREGWAMGLDFFEFIFWGWALPVGMPHGVRDGAVDEQAEQRDEDTVRPERDPLCKGT
jgi:hypothetical protein